MKGPREWLITKLSVAIREEQKINLMMCDLLESVLADPRLVDYPPRHLCEVAIRTNRKRIERHHA